MEVLSMEHPQAPHCHMFYSTPCSPRSDDFEFNFSGHLVGPTLSAADELFHAGKILPLAPPPPVIQSKPQHETHSRPHRPRGRDRRGISRSLSPLRVSEFALLQHQHQQKQQQQTNTSSSLWGSKKWRFKDLFLFRSASEGSSSPLKRLYTASISSSSSATSASFRYATELYYEGNRAVSGELKNKTSLPYRYGFLGCLGLHISSSPSSS